LVDVLKQFPFDSSERRWLFDHRISFQATTMDDNGSHRIVYYMRSQSGLLVFIGIPLIDSARITRDCGHHLRHVGWPAK
ncbi:MAG: hypothetical protein ACOVQH_05950, partial [Burkholderiaceae bacterium]